MPFSLSCLPLDRQVQSAIRLRYRLLPYIYSGFYRVASEGYTMQRGLAFDFPASLRARASLVARGSTTASRSWKAATTPSPSAFARAQQEL